MAADFSPVSNAHPEYIENLYQSYRKDPHAIDPSWSYFFNGFDYAADNGNGAANGASNGASNGAAKRLLEQGGISVNGAKLGATDRTLHDEQLLVGRFLLLRKGARDYGLLQVPPTRIPAPHHRAPLGVEAQP